MTAHLNVRLFGLAAASLMVIGYAASGNAMASQADFSQCAGNSRNGVVRCCDQLVRRQGMPIWLAQYGNCNKAVSCKSYNFGKALVFCHLMDIPYRMEKNDGGDNERMRSID